MTPLATEEAIEDVWCLTRFLQGAYYSLILLVRDTFLTLAQPGMVVGICTLLQVRNAGFRAQSMVGSAGREGAVGGSLCRCAV